MKVLNIVDDKNSKKKKKAEAHPNININLCDAHAAKFELFHQFCPTLCRKFTEDVKMGNVSSSTSHNSSKFTPIALSFVNFSFCGERLLFRGKLQ